MKSYTFFAQGDPKGQPRPRAFSRGGHARVFDPGTAEGWKGQIALAAKPHIESQGQFVGPVDVRLGFYMPRPKGHYRIMGGNRSNELSTTAPIFHAKKPDCDNLAKAVLDALTTLGAWQDDKQVVKLVVMKRYANIKALCGCEITIKEIEG